ncbi:MAG: DUF2169 domain-containing protein [Polyangiaceae bacterium]
MQVIKPFRISVLHRCFENEGKPFFSIAMLMLFPLGSKEPQLLAEKELWELVGGELGETTLDVGMPKRAGELLLQAVAHPKEPVKACRVRAKLGTLERALYVSGDRYWKDGKATEPTPFQELPISWENAFGGEGFGKNPGGKGFAPKGQEHHFRPLPNIENPDQLLRSPSMQPEPVSFLPVPMGNPERLKKLGTFDQRWLETRFPGFAADMDWSYFNAAQPAQIIDGYFQGDEAYELENLVPGDPLLRGSLPGARARCFIQRRGETQLEELRTRLDTVFLIPHRLRGVLVFRAAVPVTEDDASDIDRVLVAGEWLGEGRPAAHYQAVFERRIDPEKGFLEALRESELMPDRLPRGALGEPNLPREGFRREAAKKRVAEELERVRKLLLDAGQDPDKLLPQIPEDPHVDTDPEKIPEQVEILQATLAKKREEAEQKRVEMEAQVQKLCAQHNVDYDAKLQEARGQSGGPPKLKQKLSLEAMKQQLLAAEAQGAKVPELAKFDDPELLAKLDMAEDKLLQAYQRQAHLFPAAQPVDEDIAQQRGAALIAAARAGENLWRRDFTRADLRGAKLDELNLSGAFLEGANLSGASLRGAELSDVVLARADLRDVDLTGSTLQRANLAEADLCGAKLVSCRLEEATLMRAKLENADLEGAHLEGVMLFEAELANTRCVKTHFGGVNFIRQSLVGCDFEGADLEQAVFVEVVGSGVRFDGAQLRRATFVECRLPGSSWVRAEMHGATLAKTCELADADFRWALLERATLAGSLLRGCNFAEAQLKMANLSEVDAQGAKLYRTDLRRATLSKADLRGAVMASANAMEALLDHADLRGVDLRGANLFRSDLSKIRVDTMTQLTDALVEQARVVGRREDVA